GRRFEERRATLLVARDSVQGGPAHGTLATSGLPAVLHRDLFAVELTLGLALHAVGLVPRHQLTSLPSPRPVREHRPSNALRGRRGGLRAQLSVRTVRTSTTRTEQAFERSLLLPARLAAHNRTCARLFGHDRRPSLRGRRPDCPNLRAAASASRPPSPRVGCLAGGAGQPGPHG